MALLSPGFSQAAVNLPSRHQEAILSSQRVTVAAHPSKELWVLVLLAAVAADGKGDNLAAEDLPLIHLRPMPISSPNGWKQKQMWAAKNSWPG